MTCIKRYLIVCFVLIIASAPVLADEYFPETTPFEIALLYHKMIGVAPDFNQLAMQSPVFTQAPEIGKDIVLENQEKHLEMLFYTLSEKKPIAIIDNLSIEIIEDSENKKEENYALSEMNDSLHYIYDMAGKVYVIFVRNAAELKTLYTLSNRQKAEIKRLYNSKIKVGAEIILKPVAADATPINFQDEKMHLILADISILRLINNTNGEEIIEFKPIKERPKQSKMETFFSTVIETRRSNPWNVTD